MKKITDDNGIEYEEVDYITYLKSKNKHRIIKTLESQYFVEINNASVSKKKIWVDNSNGKPELESNDALTEKDEVKG